ncbi:helix-turn-helix domain-containing protein [Luteibacter anthropi]|uniref:helix-turn-helix domain-containing protein n=1 Tax=Luteibacter anthropi TaxID=564369 RepID=UPI00203229DE|nr:helix-turn-helix transcriptional regulator [Luteibacter anthropi]URX63972.1 helix-turn-helix domain-containing protein [Luteibacter anthropi]
MDKRFHPMSASEQLEVRLALLEDIEGHPDRPMADTIRFIRTTLRLTIAEYAKLCGVSARGLADIERGLTSPTLDTVAKLLKPMGLRVGVMTRKQMDRSGGTG